MSITKPPSTTKDRIHYSTTSILKQPLTSKSGDDIYEPPPDLTASPSSAMLSPSLSLSSSSTLHYKASTMSDHRSRSSSSITSRHFHSSALGRPPGTQKKRVTPIPTPSSSFPITSSPNKTIPMKELQKIIADLKKENFDLKLRFYHLEQQTENDMEKCWLEEENHRLQLELDDRTMQVKKLEHTVSTLLSLQQQNKSSCDVCTQTTMPPPPTSSRSTQVAAIDTTLESRSHVVQASPFSAPVLPTFPADPASFGLPPSSSLSTSAVTTSNATTRTPSFSNYNNNVDVASMVDRFQNVHLASPKVNRRHSSAVPVVTTTTTTTNSSYLKPSLDDHDHGRVSGWLDKIPFPSPSSYTYPTQSQ